MSSTELIPPITGLSPGTQPYTLHEMLAVLHQTRIWYRDVVDVTTSHEWEPSATFKYQNDILGVLGVLRAVCLYVVVI